MKVYVVWDPYLEEVVSAHKTEEGAWKGIEKANEKAGRIPGEHTCHEFDEFELED